MTGKLYSSRRYAPEETGLTELFMLETEAEDDDNEQSSINIENTAEQNQGKSGPNQRQCLGGGFFDYYHPYKQTLSSTSCTTPSVAVSPNCSKHHPCSTGSCSTYETHTDVTSSSCDTSLRVMEDCEIIMEESLEISAVDTHTSILNITEDDDFDEDNEDEEEQDEDSSFGPLPGEDSYLDTAPSCHFEEADVSRDFSPHSYPSAVAEEEETSSSTSNLLCAPSEKQNVSLVENMMESFVEHLCFSTHSSNKNNEAEQQPLQEGVTMAYRHQQDLLERFQNDMTNLLGCLDHPNMANPFEQQQPHAMLHQVRGGDGAPLSPRRTSKEQRIRRVEKLLAEQGRSSIGLLRRDGGVRSMQDLNYDHRSARARARASRYSTATPKSCMSKSFDNEGYDSDPDELWASTSSKSNKCRAVRRASSPSSVTHNWQDNIHPVVQESLNSVCDLTWHQPAASTTTPVRVTAWIERGTLIKNNSVMIEPRLMWKILSSRTAPQSIQLMHICRVIPADNSLDRTKYPLARPSTSYILRTTTNNKDNSQGGGDASSTTTTTRDYVFQASSRAERDALVQRWKVTVARFATLAVLEDADTLLKEFFVSAAFPAPLRSSSS